MTTANMNRPAHVGSGDAMPVAILGYGLDIALVSLAGWPGSSSAFSTGAFSSDSGSLFMQVKSAAFCLSFFAWFLYSYLSDADRQTIVERRWICWLFSGLYVVGSLGCLLPLGSGQVAPAGIACGMLIGIALSGNFALWVSLFSAYETPLDARCAIGGTLVGGVIYFMIAWMPALAVCLVSVILIAPGTSLALMRCVERASSHTDKVGQTPDVCALFTGEVQFPADPTSCHINLRKGILSLLIPNLAIAAIGAAMQMARLMLVGQGSSEIILGNANNLGLIASSVIALALFERSSYHIDTNVFARACAPLIALAALGLPMLGSLYGYVFSFALYTVFSWASIVGILACNQAAKHYRIPPLAMYSLMFFIIYTLRYLPSFFANAFCLLSAPDAVQALVCTLTIVSMMFCVYVAYDRYRRYQEVAQVFSWESQVDSPQPGRMTETPEEAFSRLGEGCGLTIREIEVLMLLTKGRSVPVIAQTLSVSQNTVRFHCKNLYEKFGVHSKQELLTLVEEKLASTGQSEAAREG